MTAYYNEIDPFAAAWLRELIAAGHIADGIVDEKDIRDVKSAELAGFHQCHFFAGIGVWSYALRRAGWPDDRPIWTASLPCQPFSAAGLGKGVEDERYLWPVFNELRLACRPVVAIGEQVASKGGLAWLDIVSADVEASGDAFGAVDLCAAGFGAPHIRQRLYWLAHATGERCGEARPDCGPVSINAIMPASVSSINRLDNAVRDGWGAWGHGDARNDRIIFDPTCVADAGGPTNGIWGAAGWLFCRDDKWRPVEPGTFPLAHGAPARVGRLRGYGNAINAEVATGFIEAVMAELAC